MAHRTILTERQRSVLFDLPTDETAMLRHYTLADDDLEIIRARRRPHNRFGFALQLCALRYPGRLLTPGEVIPLEITRFLAAQLGLKSDDLAGYASREETRHEHLAALRDLYSYKMFTGRGSRDLKAWLERTAETARSNEDLARRFVEQCRATQTILPGITVVERLCADALVAAERRIDARIADRLDDEMCSRLDALLAEMVDGSVTRFVWLRQFEVGQNSADMNRLLSRLEFLQTMAVDRTVLSGVPPHRIARLRRQGERYFAGDLRDISGDRRLAILAVCALEWRSAIADAVVFDLYSRLPEIRITDLLLEVDDEIGFTEAFTHLRTGVPCKDRVGMLNVLLAEGLNLGLSKMAGATKTHDYFQLSRLSRWHVEGEAMSLALAKVIEGQSALPMARFWGAGQTASNDGQFFPTTRQGEAMNLINAKYGHEPGLKAYTHVSDQFGPFATQTIPATVNEAPYILDGLLMTDAGQKIREQYADTGGFTDHVFAVTALLGFQFIPRIRDLPSKRLYLFDPASCPKELKGLIGGKVREPVISSNWPDILRSAATMVAGVMPPSQLLRKFAAYPRQHELAVALREIGRIERTLFIIDWLLDADMQRRAQIGLNKGEAHHALKNALRIGRQGEIRDRTAQGQHFRMAGLNLLAAIIIYWNTKHLGQAVTARQRDRLDCSPDLLAHISPLGWAHILLTGEYRWSKK
jgi:TnpA family transposase